MDLWGGRVGRPLTYASVNDVVLATRRAVGFHFTAHQFRHTYATVAYRDGVQLEVIGAVLTHRIAELDRDLHASDRGGSSPRAR